MLEILYKSNITPINKTVTIEKLIIMKVLSFFIPLSLYPTDIFLIFFSVATVITTAIIKAMIISKYKNNIIGPAAIASCKK